MRPVLESVSDQKDHALAEIRGQLAGRLKLSDAELAERLASGSQTVFANRIAWAVQYLKSAAAVESVARGVYRITPLGQKLLDGNPAEITLEQLRQTPEFREFEGKETVALDRVPRPEERSATVTNHTPEESLARSFQQQREALATELLNAIGKGSPAAFERLVVDLLVAMGYGGTKEDAGRVVGKSGDGGTDGEIDQDSLGLDTIYVQAKRWQDSVGSPDIMRFSGSLTRRHAVKGVFITSSGFTRDAVEYVRGLAQKIVLIDGKRLASLMIEYNVGVQPDKTYTLKRLDQSYFDDL
jgi:restriction system protein